MMATLRTLLNFVVAGALLGVLAASYLGPKYIAWDNTTSVGGAQCPCADSSRQGAIRQVYYQLDSAGVGAALGLASGGLLVWMRRKKAAAAATTPPPVKA